MSMLRILLTLFDTHNRIHFISVIGISKYFIVIANIVVDDKIIGIGHFVVPFYDDQGEPYPGTYTHVHVHHMVWNGNTFITHFNSVQEQNILVLNKIY